ncbi:MAG: metallophosphoesterase, partial [Bacteroidota bacterium]
DFKTKNIIIIMFFVLKSLFSSTTASRIFIPIYILISLVAYFSFYKVNIAVQERSLFSSASTNFYIGFIFTSLATKLFFVVLVLFQDIGRGFIGVFEYIKQLFSDGPPPESYMPGRRKALTLLSLGLSGIPFFGMLYGITKGKYRFQVEPVKLPFSDLPKAFNGFKIVQISDIHAGSYDSVEQVEKGIEMINAQEPDLVVFTGDLVNSDKNEIDPYIEVFEKIKAKHGKFAILGNHDYYGVPRNGNQDAYWKDFFAKYEAMGFKLLNNDHHFIEKDNESIALLGVENWGAGPWFPKRGDLDKALPISKENLFSILLSHDPTHWDQKVVDHPQHIHLTLSGHTHGFQFGINIPGFKWSPAQYRYPHWLGLYEKANQFLYVNRGFGFLAFPGRVGMWPEITVIELGSA